MRKVLLNNTIYYSGFIQPSAYTSTLHSTFTILTVDQLELFLGKSGTFNCECSSDRGK